MSVLSVLIPSSLCSFATLYIFLSLSIVLSLPGIHRYLRLRSSFLYKSRTTAADAQRSKRDQTTMAPPPPPPVEPIIMTGIGTDAVNSFEDLSGISSKRTSPTGTPNPEYENPYDALIEACERDPAQIQAAYQTHRTTRNANQRTRLLSADFPGVTIDPILQELEYTRDSPAVQYAFPGSPRKRREDEIDPRNCLVYWARPTVPVMDLIGLIQLKLKELAPDLWIMPRENLHLTVLEITHSTTAEFIETLIERMKPGLEKIVNHPKTHRARLVKPMLSFDAAALAVSFVPAAGKESDEYTYHHLRRDFYAMSKGANVGVTSRYIVPSAHITIARFVTSKDHEDESGAVDRAKMQAWMEKVWEINQEIENWEGEWFVGEDRGIDCRGGRLWYGGGETVMKAEGF
ncbi:RNA ligase/cyclic nucleotide phosphodiesterase [Tricharina praecox]|uniref:RNA ligase/cyclic nucleotide phosphodiesterase n=1 Tax=Tricharina praecox TaxID=43433 RepID=UPI0022209BFD|nr:RNA ligase/cyclic nucleotide phosphodiesterase [Tricharina praecox]KAI5858470.1 RNA ligase/cyclic nucleotide phosphodiesterase [Tricharina praecox]